MGLDWNFTQKVLIEKGWSEDKKYCVTYGDGKRYLLRISPSERYEMRKALFNLLKQVADLGIPMCRPVAMERTEQGVAMLYTWIDGQDGEQALSGLPQEQQYAFGYQAGEILKVIHTIPAPNGQEGWKSRFQRKIDSKLRLYSQCPIQEPGARHLIAYIEENRHLLKDCPQCFQHGDYHVGNMMIGDDGQLYIIDFDRYDFGDPWEEFNRIVWCAQQSPVFASGMVNGYFEHKPPIEFWRMLALYISSNTLSSIPWAIPFGEQEVEVMRNQLRDVLSWYDNMQEVVPKWYTA